MAETISRFVRTFRRLVWLAALLFVLQMIGAIVGLPRPLCDWLHAKDLQPNETPRAVVVLGIPASQIRMETRGVSTP